MSRYILHGLIFVTITGFLVSCSGVTPITPSESETADIPVLTSQAELSETGASHYLWGYSLVFVDPEKPEFRIVPLRQVSAHWNVLTWLENGPCTNCFKIIGVAPSGNGTLLVDIRVSHPFDFPNFTGFDVRGIAMFNGTKFFPQNNDYWSDRTLGDGALVNADGYTSLYNHFTAGSGLNGMQGYMKGKFASLTMPNATINGYKRHITSNPSNTRNAFFAGDEITVTYEIDMPNGPFIFGYAIDASWTPPVNKPVTDPITDFGPNANCSEPWKIEITKVPVGPGLGQNGGKVDVTIDVYDYQGKDSHYPPLIECPEIIGDWQITGMFSQDGVGYARYTASIQNFEHAPPGVYPCIVSVEDNDNATSPPYIELIAYQAFTLEVVELVDVPPVAVAVVSPPPYYPCSNISFSGDESIDPDGGSITLYEWDWENDGIYDQTGANVNHAWNTSGTFYVNLRVTDDESDTDEIDNPILITVQNQLPVAWLVVSSSTAGVDEEIEFDATGSYDNDCLGVEIVQYEWDWDNDGVYDQTGDPVVFHSWPSAGVYNIQLRVTDDEGGTDTLDTPKQITIEFEYQDPVAVIAHDPYPLYEGVPVHFWDDGSYDPDGGLIVNWEWDWNNDGTFDETGADVYHTWANPGNYAIQYRVTDDDGATDTLDDPWWMMISVWNPFNVEDVTNGWVNFYVDDLEIKNVPTYGDLAYIAGGKHGFFIVNVSNPMDIQKVKWVDLPGNSQGLALSGTYALVASGEAGLHIIDITDPFSASLVKTVDTSGNSMAVDVEGEYAFVADTIGGVRIIDFIPPSSASIYSTVSTPMLAVDVVTDNGYAYVAEGTSGIQIIDIEPVSSASIIKTVDTPDYANDLDVQGGYLFVGDSEAHIVGGHLEIVDVDPPETASIVETGSKSSYYLDVDGIRAYAAGDFALEIWDVTNPLNITNSKTLNILGLGLEMQHFSGYVFMPTDTEGLVVIDVDPVGSASIVESYGTTSSAQDVDVEGEYAYLVAGRTSLQVFNVTDPPNAYMAGSIGTDWGISGIDVFGDFAYVSSTIDGVIIYNISDPSSPSYVNEVVTPGDGKDVKYQNGYAYLAEAASLKIIDVSPPETAAVVGTVPTPGDAQGVAVNGIYAYVADGNSGLQIIDISSPGTASIIKTVDTPGTARKVFCQDGYAYVADGTGQLAIIDVDPPLSAYIAGGYSGTGSYIDVFVEGGFAFVAHGNMGFTLLDIDPINSCQIITTLATPSATASVIVNGDYAYVTTELDGLKIFSLY